jgi:photosystem II stability/assembly factor-like uncharacterized protein
MKKNIIKIFLMLIGFIHTQVLFGYTDWTVFGFGGGGSMSDILCHPTNPNIVWVLTDLTGIFRSTDGGVTYDRISGPLEREEMLFEWMRGVDHELVYDLSDPSIMYWAMDAGIYTTPGLYKSIDGGDTWFKIPGSPDLAPGSIVVDYNGVVYGVKYKKLYISTDKGETWEQKPDVPTYYCEDEYYWRRMYRIIIYTTKDNRIIIGDRRQGTGVFYTTDMGETWVQTLKDYEIMDVGCSPTTPGLVMALEQDGTILRSTNGGESFEEIEKVKHSYYKWGKWPAYYGGIAINKDNHVIAVGRYSLGISMDSGLTFKLYEEDECQWDPNGYIFPARQTTLGFLKCNKLTATPVSSKWYYVDAHTVKTSNDHGKSWKGNYKGIDILCVYCPPVVDILNPDIVHIGAGDNGHYYTTDNGMSWNTSETSMQDLGGLAQDPNNPSIWYKMYGNKRDRGGFLKSTDGGVHWEKLTTIPLPALVKRTDKNPSFYSIFIGRMQVDPTNSQRIFLCHRGSNGLYMSEDGGHNFKCILELVRPWELKVTKNGSIFICTWDSKGLYRSMDHGKSFEIIHDGMVHDFVVHPNNDNIIYVNAGSFTHALASARTVPIYERNRKHIDEGKGKLYKTTDGGKSWTMLGQYDGFALYIESNYPNVMLMSTRDGGQGIMRSADAGETWHSIHNSHDNYHPRGFIYGGVPGRVYSWNHNLARIDNIHIDGLESEE